MSARLNLKGRRFGRLVALRGIYTTIPARWLCRCDCGMKKLITCGNLVHARVYSCGCYHIDNTRNMLTTHGKTGTKEHNAWRGMRQRINNPEFHAFRDYGGRGIKICKRWEEFKHFLADMGYAPSSQHSLDRRNNNGHYTPSNCRWATRSEQVRNRRSRAEMRQARES